jgi:hypothetical protein
MKHRFLVPILLAAVFLLLGQPALSSAQDGAADPTEDAELEAAVIARRESAEFAQRMAELNQASQALENAIASIPDVRVIDAEMTRLRRRIRELITLRQEVIEQHSQSIEPIRREVKQAELDLAAVDPLRQVIKRRRSEAALEPVEPVR